MHGDVAQAFGLAHLGHSAGTYTGVPVEAVEEEPPWQTFAACRPELRPPDMTVAEWTDLFFPARGESTRPARQYCAICPVLDECRNAGRSEKHGIWGGTSERQRRGKRRSADDSSRDVVALVREGLTDERIAARLGLSVHTVKARRLAAGMSRRATRQQEAS